MAGWSNKKYVEWLILNRVPEATACLVEVGWDDGSGWIPVRLEQVSKRGVDGGDLFVPGDGKPYRLLYFHNTKKPDNYLIGLGDIKKFKR